MDDKTAQPGGSVCTEDVIAAANALSAAGVKPTYAAVREQLGKKGSYTTINKGMKQWASQAEREAQPDGAPAQPEGVKVLFDRLWSATWGEALRVAEASFDLDRKKLQEEARAAADAAEQAGGLARQLEVEIEEADGRIRQRDAEISALQETIRAKDADAAQSSVELATAAERIKQLEQRLEQAQGQLRAANELNQSLAKLIESGGKQGSHASS